METSYVCVEHCYATPRRRVNEMICKLSGEGEEMSEEEKKQEKLNSKLLRKCAEGDLASIQQLLSTGANINYRYPGCAETPLVITVYRHYVEPLKYLLNQGADVNITDPNGHSLLYRAVETLTHTFRWERSKPPDYTIVQELLRHGADVGTVLAVDHSPRVANLLRNDHLMNRMICEIQNLILDHRIDTDIDLHFSLKFIEHIWNTPNDLSRDERLALSKCVLSLGFNENSESLFLFALKHGLFNVIKFMMRAGASPKAYTFKELMGRDQMLKLASNTPGICQDFAIFHICRFKISPFLAASLKNHQRTMKLFLDSNFLNSLDLRPPFIYQRVIAKLNISRRQRNPMFFQFCRQPKSLFTLAFVKVSMCVGFQSDRFQRIENCGLPLAVQRDLMFQLIN